MRLFIPIITFAAVVAGCQADTATTATAPAPRVDTASANQAVAGAERSAFVGTWSGRGQSNDTIRVVVPARGDAYYIRSGSRAPTVGERFSGNRLVMPFRGSGQVTLTLDGDTMIYRYRGRGGTNRAVLTRT